MAGGMTRNHPEQKFQRVITSYFGVIFPKTVFWSAIDHSGGGAKLGAIHKSAGVKSGLPDLLHYLERTCTFHRNQDWHYARQPRSKGLPCGHIGSGREGRGVPSP